MHILSEKQLARNIEFEYFFGAWNLNKELTLDPNVLDKITGASYVIKHNFFLVSSTFASKSGSKCLFCLDHNGNHDALLFRGYILDPPLHSLSDKDKIIRYWDNAIERVHNGVFAVVRIKNNGQILEMLTDAFGISPLYYRKLGQTILFASSPRFLSIDGDQQDLVAWRCLMQSGFIPGNRSLSIDVERVPPGTIVRFEGPKKIEKRWFDFSHFPGGDSNITPQAVDIVEEAFAISMDRSLKLDASKRLLPLSSGYDSRHILGYLLNKRETFQSVTVRTLDAKYRDIDALFSSRMARDFGFPHQVHETPEYEQSINAERTRSYCLDFESPMHAWYLPVWERTDDSMLVLDGLCGDTLGHSGLKISGLRDRYVPEHVWIAQNVLHPVFDPVLNDRFWPKHADIVREFANAISPLPLTNNLIDLSMIMHRARRAISISSQQFAKPGHIVVYPYLDLDYVLTILNYNPVARFRNSLQAQCLKKYYPAIFNYPGSHNLPWQIGASLDQDKSKPLFSQYGNNYEHLYSEMKNVFPYIKQIKSLQCRILGKNLCFLKCAKWWITPILDFLDRQKQPKAFTRNYTI